MGDGSHRCGAAGVSRSVLSGADPSRECVVGGPAWISARPGCSSPGGGAPSEASHKSLWAAVPSSHQPRRPSASLRRRPLPAAASAHPSWCHHTSSVRGPRAPRRRRPPARRRAGLEDLRRAVPLPASPEPGDRQRRRQVGRQNAGSHRCCLQWLGCHGLPWQPPAKPPLNTAKTAAARRAPVSHRLRCLRGNVLESLKTKTPRPLGFLAFLFYFVCSGPASLRVWAESA